MKSSWYNVVKYSPFWPYLKNQN